MIKRFLPILFSIFTFLYAASAQVNSVQFFPVKDQAAFKETFSKTSQSIESFKSKFTQEKNLSMLSEKIISTGIFYFKKTNMVRLEYTSPFHYLMVINKTKVLIKDDMRETKMDVQSSKLFQQINKIMIDCVQGTIFSNDDFTISTFKSDTEYKLELIPRTKGLADIFSSIYLFTDKQDFTATKLQMNEIGGDYTLITFSNKELNTPLGDELFTVK